MEFNMLGRLCGQRRLQLNMLGRLCRTKQDVAEHTREVRWTKRVRVEHARENRWPKQVVRMVFARTRQASDREGVRCPESFAKQLSTVQLSTA